MMSVSGINIKLTIINILIITFEISDSHLWLGRNFFSINTHPLYIFSVQYLFFYHFDHICSLKSSKMHRRVLSPVRLPHDESNNLLYDRDMLCHRKTSWTDPRPKANLSCLDDLSPFVSISKNSATRAIYGSTISADYLKHPLRDLSKKELEIIEKTMSISLRITELQQTPIHLSHSHRSIILKNGMIDSDIIEAFSEYFTWRGIFQKGQNLFGKAIVFTPFHMYTIFEG